MGGFVKMNNTSNFQRGGGAQYRIEHLAQRRCSGWVSAALCRWPLNRKAHLWLELIGETHPLQFQLKSVLSQSCCSCLKLAVGYSKKPHTERIVLPSFLLKTPSQYKAERRISVWSMMDFLLPPHTPLVHGTTGHLPTHISPSADLPKGGVCGG